MKEEFLPIICISIEMPFDERYVIAWLSRESNDPVTQTFLFTIHVRVDDNIAFYWKTDECRVELCVTNVSTICETWFLYKSLNSNTELYSNCIRSFTETSLCWIFREKIFSFSYEEFYVRTVLFLEIIRNGARNAIGETGVSWL